MSQLFDNIPDLTGMVAIVTGGNVGIGKATCRVFTEKGARVYMASRTKEKALEAIDEIKKSTGKDNIFYLPLDLSSLGSISEASDIFLSKEKELHILVNNAGIMATPLAYTKDGYEMQWGTNVVGHFALTKKLLPTLLDTASHSAKGSVRVINVSSEAHSMAPRGGVDFNDIGLLSYWFAEWRRYGQSKLGNILLTKEIAKRYQDKNILSLTMHPGVINTQLHANTMDRGWFVALVKRLSTPAFISEDEGAYTQIYAATHPDVTEKMNGKYLVPMGTVATPSRDAENAELATKLWDYLEKELESKQ